MDFWTTSKENKTFSAITIQGLWYAWNKLIHEGLVQQVKDVVTFIQGNGREF